MKIEIFTPPSNIRTGVDKTRLFLAGSIEQGTAEEWQQRVIKELQEFESPNDVQIFNPRREQWDSSWPQDPDHTEFRKQVQWELDAIDLADVVFFWFDGNTKSPVTMLELGICLANPDKRVIVYCPPEFWRAGNVVITCQQFGVSCYRNADQALLELKALLKKPHKRIYED